MNTTTAIQIRYTRQPSPIRGKSVIQVLNFNRTTVTNVEIRTATDMFPYFACYFA